LLRAVVELDRAGREVEAAAHACGEGEKGYRGVSDRVHEAPKRLLTSPSKHLLLGIPRGDLPSTDHAVA
jgi:hypothetical protein